MIECTDYSLNTFSLLNDKNKQRKVHSRQTFKPKVHPNADYSVQKHSIATPDSKKFVSVMAFAENNRASQEL